MTETPRPVPHWLFVWSIVTLGVAAAVVVLGSLITTFRVGMSDPVWPTEPWFLIVNDHVWVREPARGYLIEHTHRLVAWSIGVFAAVLAFGAWWTEPSRRLRWAGLAVLFTLLGAYLALHGEMGVAWRARKAGGELQWPSVTGPATALAALGLLGVAYASLKSKSPGSGFRVLAALGLLAVMVQGLLGGYRVFLDQLMGTQLAAIHGSFGQVTLALLAAVVTLAVRPAPLRRNAPFALSAALAACVVFQLIWGVWVRHMGSPVAQRLHIVTAFLVFALAVVLSLRILADTEARKGLRFAAYGLLAILLSQVILGVEAYLGKFAVAGPEALLPPEMRAITNYAAVVRTTHTLLGAALLSVTVALAVRIRLRVTPETSRDGVTAPYLESVRRATLREAAPV